MPTEDQVRRLVEILRYALSCKGDDICWKDVYNEEVAHLVGLDGFDPGLLPKEQFLRNCSHFHDCLKSGEPYQTPDRKKVDEVV